MGGQVLEYEYERRERIGKEIGKAEGIAEGKAKGEARLAALYAAMSKAGATIEQLSRVMEDLSFRAQMYAKYNI